MNKATLLHIIKDLPDEAEFQVMTNYRFDNDYEPVTLINDYEPVTLIEIDDDVSDWEAWGGEGPVPKKVVVKLIAG